MDPSRPEGGTRSPTLVSATLWLLVPSLSAAQTRTIRGVVVDSLRQTVPFVNISTGGSLRVIGDDSGRFRIEVAGDRPLSIALRRIGYLPAEARFQSPPDSLVIVTMFVAPTRLAAVNVMADEMSLASLEKHGFYRRLRDANAGGIRGWFITPEDVERRNPGRTSHLLDGIPGVKLTAVRGGGRSALVPTGTDQCMMTLYVDGVRIWPTTPNHVPRTDRRTGRSTAPPGFTPELSIDALIPSTNIAAVEIYPRRTGAPLEFPPQTPDGCGAVVAWTK